MRGTYSLHVNSKWNVFRGPIALTAIALLALAGTGCGGLGASGSVSPASFLLPGFGQIDSQRLQQQESSQELLAANPPQVTAIRADLVP